MRPCLKGGDSVPVDNTPHIRPCIHMYKNVCGHTSDLRHTYLKSVGFSHHTGYQSAVCISLWHMPSFCLSHSQSLPRPYCSSYSWLSWLILVTQEKKKYQQPITGQKRNRRGWGFSGLGKRKDHKKEGGFCLAYSSKSQPTIEGSWDRTPKAVLFPVPVSQPSSPLPWDRRNYYYCIFFQRKHI